MDKNLIQQRDDLLNKMGLQPFHSYTTDDRTLKIQIRHLRNIKETYSFLPAQKKVLLQKTMWDYIDLD